MSEEGLRLTNLLMQGKQKTKEINGNEWHECMLLK